MKFIRVIKSKPKDGQDGIAHLIGKIFDARINEEKNEAQVECKEFGGQIILNADEWEEVLLP